jgi:hypothetical protein
LLLQLLLLSSKLMVNDRPAAVAACFACGVER